MTQSSLFGTQQLPTLYARDENGGIRVWDIEIDGNKFRAITGLMGGARVTNAWTVCTGKNIGQANETDGDQQAWLEATSKWKKKIKSGGYYEDINHIDNVSRYIEPMLAHKLRDHADKVKLPVMVDKKYNGGRVISDISGFFTRKGEQYATIPHIIEAVEPLFLKYPSLVLDGEGYNHDLRFKLNELMSILRTTKASKITPELLAKSERIVRLYVYDGYGFDGITEKTGCRDRREGLKNLLKGVPYVVWVPYRMATTMDEVHKYYGEDIADGYEGSMIRNADAPYEHRRSYNLLKVKPTDDGEGIIVSINAGVGNASKLAATATLIWNGPDGKVEFDATFMGSIETREDILKNPDQWIGQEVTFLYNGLTGKYPRKPNYARIDPDNCLQGKK
jgi:ATP-dependent DNA ligase